MFLVISGIRIKERYESESVIIFKFLIMIRIILIRIRNSGTGSEFEQTLKPDPNSYISDKHHRTLPYVLSCIKPESYANMPDPDYQKRSYIYEI